MTIYEELIKRVTEGEPFYINFKNKSLKIGKKFIITDGVYDTSRKLFGKNKKIFNGGLYEQYLRSNCTWRWSWRLSGC